jgi:hypothetical protein
MNQAESGPRYASGEQKRLLPLLDSSDKFHISANAHITIAATGAMRQAMSYLVTNACFDKRAAATTPEFRSNRSIEVNVLESDGCYYIWQLLRLRY